MTRLLLVAVDARLMGDTERARIELEELTPDDVQVVIVHGATSLLLVEPTVEISTGLRQTLHDERWSR